MKSLMPLILIAVSIGVFVIFVDPQYEEIRETKQTIDENKNLLELANQLRRERNTLSDKYTAISQGDREKLQKVLPDNVDNVRLILDIQDIANEFGIQILNINVQANQDSQQDGRLIDNTNQQYGTIGVNFSVSAEYDVFKNFMRRLEDSLRLIDIQSFSVSAGDGLFYNYNVSFNTYWLR
jgi:hypothetical protein